MQLDTNDARQGTHAFISLLLAPVAVIAGTQLFCLAGLSKGPAAAVALSVSLAGLFPVLSHSFKLDGRLTNSAWGTIGMVVQCLTTTALSITWALVAAGLAPTVAARAGVLAVAVCVATAFRLWFLDERPALMG